MKICEVATFHLFYFSQDNLCTFASGRGRLGKRSTNHETWLPHACAVLNPLEWDLPASSHSTHMHQSYVDVKWNKAKCYAMKQGKMLNTCYPRKMKEMMLGSVTLSAPKIRNTLFWLVASHPSANNVPCTISHGKLAQVEEAVAVFSISVGLRLLICCMIHI